MICYCKRPPNYLCVMDLLLLNIPYRSMTTLTNKRDKPPTKEGRRSSLPLTTQVKSYLQSNSNSSRLLAGKSGSGVKKNMYAESNIRKMLRTTILRRNLSSS